MSKRLKEMTVGDSGRVVGFWKGGKAYRKKLLSMGLTPGAVPIPMGCRKLPRAGHSRRRAAGLAEW